MWTKEQEHTYNELTNEGISSDYQLITLYQNKTPPENGERVVLSDGRGELIEITPDGQVVILVSEAGSKDTDAPTPPMCPNTNRGGVLGYMCQIDFEFELGLAKGGVSIYPSASEAYCTSTCGVVEVEVVGRKVVVPTNFEDVDNIEEYKEKIKDRLKTFDEERKI